MAITPAVAPSSPPRPIKAHPRALRLLLRTPLAPPAPPPRPHRRRPSMKPDRRHCFDLRHRRGRSRLKEGAYPLGGPRWTDRPGPRARSTVGVSSCATTCVSSASTLRQPANRSSPCGATAASPPAALAILQKEPPVSRIHKYTLPPI
jgi:hypothetical protein